MDNMSSSGNNGQSVSQKTNGPEDSTQISLQEFYPFGFDHVRLYILWHTKFGANTYKHFTRHSMENAIFNVSIWLQSPLHELTDPVNTIH